MVPDRGGDGGVSDCDRLLAELRTGPKTHLELYGKCGVVHSRAAELRQRGYRIDVEASTNPDGRRVYVYSLRQGVAGGGRTQRSNTVSVREAREQRGWTLRELAKRAGMSPGLLSLLERDRYVPSSVEVLGLSKAFGKPLVRKGRPTLRVAA